MNKVYHIGYGKDGALVEQLMNSDPNILLMDTRKYPTCSWSEEWKRPFLYRKYRDRYHFCGSLLGNENIGIPGAPIKIIDPVRGIHGLIGYLKEGHDLILLCQCRKYEECHRKVIVDLLKEKMPEVDVVMPNTEEDTIPCLSIYQPWTWVIAHGYKDIENRDWSTNYRGPILLHASKKIDLDWFYPRGCGERTGKLFSSLADRFGLGGVMPDHRSQYPVGGIVGIADLVDVVTESDSVWFCGCYGFVLQNARSFDLIPYKGNFKLFNVHKSVVAHVLPEPATVIQVAQQALL